jgi:TetR/AcrR family transcriptional regulator
MKQRVSRKIVRARRDRPDLRERLIDAALEEFSAHGFEGASTRAIALRVGAHQPQINYHFASKDALWRAAIDHLFARLVENLDASQLAAAPASTLPDAFADLLRRFVCFAAEHPELNRIMVHEATAPGPRLVWLTEHHVQPYFDALQPIWRRLVDAGVAAPIDARLIHHVLVGATSLVFVNAHEFELLTGEDPTSARWVERHAEGLIAMLLPGRGRPVARRRSPARR